MAQIMHMGLEVQDWACMNTTCLGRRSQDMPFHQEVFMTTKSHNAKKPKLAGHPSGHAHPDGLASLEAPGALPGKHKMSFAQHQHEQQHEHTPSPMLAEAAPAQHLKADAQQHQQKAHAHK